MTENNEEIETQDMKKESKEWTAIRGECISGGELNELCNLVAASQGHAEIEVVQKKLICGCLLVPADAEEIIL